VHRVRDDLSPEVRTYTQLQRAYDQRADVRLDSLAITQDMVQRDWDAETDAIADDGGDDAVVALQTAERERGDDEDDLFDLNVAALLQTHAELIRQHVKDGEQLDREYLEAKAWSREGRVETKPRDAERTRGIKKVWKKKKVPIWMTKRRRRRLPAVKQADPYYHSERAHNVHEKDHDYHQEQEDSN